MPLSAHTPEAVRGSAGIQPFCNPREYDHCGDSTTPLTEEGPIFHVQKNQFCHGRAHHGVIGAQEEKTYLEGVHACQCKVHNVRLHRGVPTLPIVPRGATANDRPVPPRIIPLVARAETNAIDPQSAVRDSIAKFACTRQAECAHRGIKGRSPSIARSLRVR